MLACCATSPRSPTGPGDLLDALRNWWASLFGKQEPRPCATGVRGSKPRPAAPAAVPRVLEPVRRRLRRRPRPGELVAYTFLALDSWAWDRDCGREPTETPLEFAARLGEVFPDLAEAFTRFARVYARVSYSDAPPPADTLAVLEETWDGLVHGVAVA